MIVENWIVDWVLKTVGFIVVVFVLALIAWCLEMKKSGKL